jgi:hypothetical protein
MRHSDTGGKIRLMASEFQDKVLKCKDCGEEFIWTAGEQEFFSTRGFKNKPARCKECRKKNRQKVEAEYFSVRCDNCRQVGDVLFRPQNPDAKIYCKKCFDELFLKTSV